MGNFDVHKFEVEGKPHFFVATPAGTFNAEKSAQFTDMLAKVAAAHSETFGGLPYEKYVYFYFFAPPESNASGALEHLNSFVAFAPPGEQARPEQTDRNRVARVLSSLECKTHPPRRDVAVRLLA